MIFIGICTFMIVSIILMIRHERNISERDKIIRNNRRGGVQVNPGKPKGKRPEDPRKTLTEGKYRKGGSNNYPSRPKPKVKPQSQYKRGNKC